MKNRLIAIALAVVGCLVLPAIASAQSTIAGLVRDTSGGVLPGVTVEASSPALIEKVRTAITDDQGRYSIIDLRPGSYTVTFTLPGFATVRREGLELNAAFTATVNADMQVGAVAESITVTGEAPMVDVQRSKNETVLESAILDATPNTWRNVTRYTALIPGVEASQGGFGRGLAQQAGTMAIHGGRANEANVNLDGVSTRHNTVGGNLRYMVNQAMVQEVTVSIGGASADQQQGGIVQNVIQRSGGNTLSGLMYFHYLNEGFSGENIDNQAALLGRGSSGKLIESWDVNPALGGPIMRDRLWFYGSYRHNGNEVDAGVRYNLTPTGWEYTPDESQDNATFRLSDQNYSLRLTWQANQRNQFTMFVDHNPRAWYNRLAGPTVSPEAGNLAKYIPNRVVQFTWKSPINSNWLAESNATILRGESKFFASTPANTALMRDAATPDPANLIGAIELSTGMAIRSVADTNGYGNGQGTSDAFRTLGAVSYVTGSHTAKFGFDLYTLERRQVNYHTGDMTFSLRNGLPTQLTQRAPVDNINRVRADLGLYVQDRWTIDRLTINAGLRYDYFNGFVPAQTVPGNRWLPSSSFPEVKNVPLWHDLSPRIGLVYDLFGNGNTAIKASVNRYVNGEAVVTTNSMNPASRRVTTATRTWTDSNGNFVPDCNFAIPGASGECGSISNVNFGLNNPNANQTDPELLEGFGVRGYQWTGSAGLQHQLTPQLAVNAAYNRRWYGNFTATENLALGGDPSVHYDPYCVTLPRDSRLPGGGGNQVCGFYDIKAAMRGQVQNFVTESSKFGKRTEVYNGFDLGLTARFARGQFSGGSSTGRTTLNSCFIVTTPQDLQFCETRPPMRTQVKFSGVYELPWSGIQLSGVFQSLPGPEILTTYVATNAEIAPSLGRSLSAGATSTVTLSVVPPGTQFADRSNTTDIRVSKIFRSGGAEWIGSLDIFNLFNSDGAQAVNGRYGPQYLNPTAILNARYYKASIQFNF